MSKNLNSSITPTHFFGSEGTDTGSDIGRFTIAEAAALFASSFQPLDSDLTSWAAVTRAVGFDTFVATPSSANLRALLSDEVGTGAVYFVGGALGTPASGNLENCTGYPFESLADIPLTFPPAAHDHPFSQITSTPTTLSGYGITDAQPLDSDLTSWASVTRASGFDTFVATPTSANLRALLTDEDGTGAAYFVGGALGTPSSGTLTNCTGLPTAGLVNDAVTFAKMQEISGTTLVGRHSGGSGDIQEVSVGGGIEFSGSGIRRSALSGDVTASAGSDATTIANDSVTYAKMQNVSAATRLLGRGDSGSGDVQEITLGTNLTMSGTTLNASGGGGGEINLVFINMLI